MNETVPPWQINNNEVLYMTNITACGVDIEQEFESVREMANILWAWTNNTEQLSNFLHTFASGEYWINWL